MFKFPMVIVYMIIAFNLTAFTLLLQLDFLIFNAIIYKVIAWIVTLAAWRLAYVKRDQFVRIF